MAHSDQLTATLATTEQLRQAWAFAKTAPKQAARTRRRRRAAMADVRQAIITACSKQARQLGIQVGMTYADAKRCLPELRILVIGA